MAERLGFIGLGIMGQIMAHHLLQAGYPLTVWNRNRTRMDALVQEGARPAQTPQEVGTQSDIVITIVSDTAAVEEVMLGEQGVLKGAHPGLIVIDMSTISPQGTKAIAEQAKQYGVEMLDAPVSGGDVGAREGKLSIMVGGEREIFERVQPIFNVLGQTIIYCGASGAGQTVKACNQIVIALILEGIAEGLVLGSKMGINPEILVQVMSKGLAQNRVLDLRGATMIHHQFEPGARVKLHHKDLGIVLDVARQCGVSLPGTSLVAQFFNTLIETGYGEMDHSSLLTVIEMLSHHSLVKTDESQ